MSDGLPNKRNNPTSLVSPGRVTLFVILALGVLGCCCTGIIGTWMWNKPAPFPGTWQGEEVVVRSQHQLKHALPRRKATRIELILRSEDNGEQTGLYRADDGEPLPLKWKADRNTLELEITGHGQLWTGEQKGRFAYTLSEHASYHELRLEPASAESAPVRLVKSKPRPWPT